MAIAAFVVGAVVSLGTSWVLVTRLERLGERLGFSEGLLGLLAALAADTPEITSAVTALVHHERAVGSGVVIGSNVFNLAALLGLGAVVAGRIGLHRRVVVLGGAVASWVAFVTVVAVVGLVGPATGLALALAVFVPYIALLATGSTRSLRLRLPRGWATWMAAAVAEEESELAVAIRPRPGTWPDAGTAAAALVAIVGSSVVMERAASSVGRDHEIAGIVVGGLVLAAVTSLPNAVAGVYLARRGRGAAVLEHHARQQHLQRGARVAPAGDGDRIGGAVGPGVPRRRLVRRADRDHAGLRLYGARPRPRAGMADRRRLRGIRGVAPGCV